MLTPGHGKLVSLRVVDHVYPNRMNFLTYYATYEDGEEIAETMWLCKQSKRAAIKWAAVAWPGIPCN